jgi:hypothetical protein
MGNALTDMAQDAKNAPIGGGLAKMASNKLSDYKEYQKYVAEAQSNGEEPKSLEEWRRGNT